jgi:hypothetical protein
VFLPHWKNALVTVAPFGFTVPERVAPFVLIEVASPVVELGASGAKNDCSEPQIGPPAEFVAQST